MLKFTISCRFEFKCQDFDVPCMKPGGDKAVDRPEGLHIHICCDSGAALNMELNYVVILQDMFLTDSLPIEFS